MHQQDSEKTDEEGSIVLQNRRIEYIPKIDLKLKPIITMLDLSGNLIKKIDIDSTITAQSVTFIINRSHSQD